MSGKVFFAWQADTPNRVGRSLIEAAANSAIKRIAADLTLDEPMRDAMELDHDTKGEPGQPPIVDTIFRKISASLAFIADLTFTGIRIGREGKPDRPTPNPNVLIEYGYALKALSHRRLIPIMNAAYGTPSDITLPFDMKHLRWPHTYNLAAEATADQKKKELQALAQHIEMALRAILSSDDYRASVRATSTPPPFSAAEP